MTGQLGLAVSLGHIDHMVRYGFVSPFVMGKRVLDIACGTGYGSQYIALQGALQVTGIDIDQDSIDYARKFHSHGAVRYIRSDAHLVSDLEAASFDVIVSFETIEHVERPRDFVLELRRLLKPGGQCFISCPNDYRVSPWISGFHLHKFKFAEFRELVVNAFGEATFLGQHNTCMSCLLKPTSIHATSSQFEGYREPLPPAFFGNQYADYLASIENGLGYFAVVGVDPALISNTVAVSESAFEEVMASHAFALSEAEKMRQETENQQSLRGELARIQAEQEDQQGLRSELARTQTELRLLQSKIVMMERSTFWKARRALVRLRNAVGLGAGEAKRQ